MFYDNKNNMSFGSIIGFGIANMIPLDVDPTLKNMTGMMLGGIIETGIDKTGTGISKYIKSLFNSNEFCITISKDHNNPIYRKIEQYIIHKHISELQKCPIEADNGEICLKIKGAILQKPIYTEYEGHKIKMIVSEKDLNEIKNSDGDVSSLNIKSTDIKISSKTCSISELKKYVESLCDFKRDKKIMTTFKAIVKNGKNRDNIGYAEWKMSVDICNKTIENTILADNQLYQDINWFMNNELWYNTRGIPYKRGYILYGEPGTGKTSVIKAIANKYDLDIFSIQMDNISDSSQFVELMGEINEINGHKKYILALEDFDRSSVIKDSYYSSVRIPTILNELDGVNENYGRLLFITCNDRKSMKNKQFDALFRPGRIDKEFSLSYCTDQQFKEMVKYYVDIDVDIKLNKQITPAQVIKIIQQYADKPDELISILKKMDSNNESNSNQNIEEVQKNLFQNIQMIDPKMKKNNNMIKRKENLLQKRRRILKNNKSKLKQIIKDYENISKLEDKIKKDEQLVSKYQTDIRNRKRKAKELISKKKPNNKKRKIC